MTLPITTILPTVPDFKDLEEVKKYLHDLNFELQNTYEKSTQNVNGFFRNNFDVDGSQYIPTLEGSTTAGSFDYQRQGSYVLRQGLMTDVWFDVIWTSSGAAAGQLLLILPYKLTLNTVVRFVGTCYTNDAVFPGGRTGVFILGVMGTYQASFQVYGSAQKKVALDVYGSGRVSGHLRYIGVEDE